MDTLSPLAPDRALARLMAVVTNGAIGRRPEDVVRLDALEFGPIRSFLATASEEGHPDLDEVCAPFRALGGATARILLLALAEGVTGPRPLELRERALFHRIASLLGVRVTAAAMILVLASREHAAVESGSDPHAADARLLLGLGADETADAIDAAYLARIIGFSPAAAVPLGAGAIAFAVRWLSEFTLARETLLARLPPEGRWPGTGRGHVAMSDDAAATVSP
jgi:hypothetical protein